MTTSSTRISICVCTCRRPRGLQRLLASLAALDVPPQAEIELIVVDNDAQHSGELIAVEAFGALPWPARYVAEPTPGVSHARNRCIEQAQGEWLAFIDDDEWPQPDWLLRLLGTARASGSEIVMSTIQPVFEAPVPAWVAASGAFAVRGFETSQIVDWKFCASGNVLLRRELAQRLGGFDPIFGATGAEDTDFFLRCERAGVRAVWCQEAVVSEAVPAERLTREWVLARSLAGGRNYARIARRHAGLLAGLHIGLRGLVGWLGFGLAARLARLLAPERVGRYERNAAVGLGKLTPNGGRRLGQAGHYGDARRRLHHGHGHERRRQTGQVD